MTMAPIAIIGIGLRLPQADDMAAFWRHLAAGRSLISEVPPERWSAAALRGNPASGHYTSSIWGGFLADADRFDAPFFGISPREAAWMDPQQRFALEMAWHAIEDAGYRADALAGSRTGVYMGVCHWDYAELLEKHLAEVDAYTPTGIALSIIANRVSHHFDLRGPSIANDTACAASLTAMYEAVRALRDGDCDMALAGGVNLCWSPNHFVAFSKAGMLSRDGRGMAFDASANGYVRGEGGAMVLLKPLDRALADGDPIHGVIRGIGVNHGGRTNSLTVTNPQAQAALIAEVHRAAEVSPASLSYVEAHGPGTPLGDPIEFAGLKDAFAALHAEAGTAPVAESCGIGSVKTNIGHLEGAAGIAGLAKVLAAFAHDQLPANVGFATLNPLIDLTDTPFRIQRDATQWPRSAGAPRRAGISSFGFGGSNAHMVVEEPPVRPAAPATAVPFVFPLSARDDDRLNAYAQALLDSLDDSVALSDLAHTLQIGRMPMAARLAVRAATIADLRAALQAHLAGTDHPALHHPGGSGTDALAQAWCDGGAVDWPAVPGARRIHAPLYPFARLRYWMDATRAGKDPSPVPHPLLHRNVSGFHGLHFQSHLDGDAPVWADHHVGGRRILPGMAVLDMVRAALALGHQRTAGDATPIHVRDITWLRPVTAAPGGTAVDLRITAGPEDFAFTLSCADAGGLCAQGQASFAVSIPPALAVGSGPGVPVEPDACYAALRASGVDHGPAFRLLQRVVRHDDGVVADLRLGRLLHASLAALPLHPLILDAAVQAWIALDGMPPAGAAVPFACASIHVLRPCQPAMQVRARRTRPVSTDAVDLDIDLCDGDGALCVALRGLTLRIMGARLEPAGTTVPADLLHFVPAWVPQPALAGASRHVSFVMAELPSHLVSTMAQPAQVLPSPTGNMAGDAIAWFEALRQPLADALRHTEATAIIVLASAALPAPLLAPLASLFRTAAAEQPRFVGAVVRIEGPLTPLRLAAIAAQEAQRADAFTEIVWRSDDTRCVLRPEAMALPAATASIASDGVYWISGGLGGIGLHVADWLVTRGARTLILSGRTAQPDERARAVLDDLAARGARVACMSCDVADAAAVDALVRHITDELGPLRGIVHAAGVLDDGLILTRDPAAARRTFAPKVSGALNIDRATAHLPLDFLVLCSSIAGVFGNPGQADYGAANAFLDAFADWRADQVAAGRRHGATHAIAWPLWQDGGMRVDEGGVAALRRRFGTAPLPTAAALAALSAILTTPGSRHIVMTGDRARIEAVVATHGQAQAAATTPAAAGAPDRRAAMAALLRDLLAEHLQIDPAQIRTDRRLEEYGLDSIVIVEVTNRLEEKLGPLSKTLFFEFLDIDSLAAHLAATHGAALAEPAAAIAAAITPSPARKAEPQPVAATGRDGTHDIAIVGRSLRVARASSQDEFWDMLSRGLHGFTAVPADRWDHAALLHPDRDVLGKTVVRTGAFIDGIDRFDPRYFRISQREAELMSPEVRLFLQASVEAFEDAGYSREYMLDRLQGDVAVIAASMTNEYDLYGFQNMLVRGAPASGSYTGTLPNMVSYFYGFTGPSYFLDTMCSASSTCVHEAVHMLRAGRCRMALAGGVSLLLHPQKLIATSQEHFTSRSAEVIRGYGLGADGTILGEGVGALVLKRLDDALRDGDQIHGVIVGTGISNAGVRNGFTVPSPQQQAAAIEAAFADAGLTPDAVSYVEGHGSGTALGDPIEVRALTQVWQRHGVPDGSCPIGTVKGNVAHLLAASGLAGIVKVLAQLRHGQLAPSLHAETLNPNIPFERTPFRVQRELAPWPRRGDAPRRAGITSIGAGGMNSHILVEEHVAAPRPAATAAPQLFVFSAMNAERLLALLARFRDHLRADPGVAADDLAYTLQVGRNELPCRLALVAATVPDLLNRIDAFIAAPASQTGLFYTPSTLSVSARDAAGPLAANNLPALGEAWSSGARVDWDGLPRARPPHRISLPAYPFEGVRCWYPSFDDAPSVTAPLGASTKLHPLVGRNESDLGGLRYTTRLHLDELLDYLTTAEGRRTLLSTAALEVPLAVAGIAGLSGALDLSDLRASPIADWATVNALVITVARGDGGRLRIDVAADASPWLAATVEPSATRPVMPLLAALPVVPIYADLAARGHVFKPYGEVLSGAVRHADGTWQADLLPQPAQQDHAKRHVHLPAPLLAALHQLLLLAQPDRPHVDLTACAGLRFAGGHAVRLFLRPRPDSGFDAWAMAADGTCVAHVTGLATDASHLVPQAAVAPAADALVDDLRAMAAALLKFPVAEVDPRAQFHDLGFDSISLTRFAADIGTAHGLTLSPAIFFECENLAALADHLAVRHGATPRTAPAVRTEPVRVAAPLPMAIAPAPSDAIAIVGMAGRFPGAADVDTFFARLLAGEDLTGPLPLDRYSADYRRRMQAGGFALHGGFLADVDRFDAAAFRISPVEAQRMDPQQRLLLEVAWHAMEHAGYRPDELPRDTGVFVGVSALDYAELLAAHGVTADGQVATGNSLAMVANRLSHVFDWHGPSQSIDTACSSSLVALLRAADALRAGRCAAALVGGVNLALALPGFAGPHQAGMLSATGRCHTFGAAADGYARGEGVVAVLLKPLAAAERDGDNILALFLGGAENHGGRAGALTAPNARAQADLVRSALSGIDPAMIGYVEAHGTGTALGDPVEVNGLRHAFAGRPSAAPPIAVGSVKSNIGHLEAAAGLSGLVKVVQALRHRRLPPTLHCDPINPHLNLADTSFELVHTARDWPAPVMADGSPRPRTAGISSFGFGGTNAHVVIGEYAGRAAPRRQPLPPRVFAATRHWLPGVADDVVHAVPDWQAERIGTVRLVPQRHIVVSCGLALPDMDVDTRTLDLPADPASAYAAAAAQLLTVVQDVARTPGDGRVVVQLVLGPRRHDLTGLVGLLRSAQLEHPRLIGQVHLVDDNLPLPPLAAEARTAHADLVHHRATGRFVRQWREAQLSLAPPPRWPSGVVLITGGLGGIGRVVASALAHANPDLTLILTGRRPAAMIRDVLRALPGAARIDYRQLDCADAAAVRVLAADIAATHGRLDAVFHCAGVLRDGLLLRQSAADLAMVLAPKVVGTQALIDACATLAPRIVLFSSIGAVAGNIGQCGYAAANGFLAGQAGGAVRTIHWPLWRDGGMRVDDAVAQRLFDRMGQRPLATEAALATLWSALAGDCAELAVMAGDGARIRAFLAAPMGQPAVAAPAADRALHDAVAARLVRVLADVAGLPASAIDAAVPLEEYGIDSLMITRINQRLDGAFGALPRTLLFQYRTIAALAAHLAATRAAECAAWTGQPAGTAAASRVDAPPAPSSVAPGAPEPIAIVGLSGTYPGAETLDEFWRNLAHGVDAVGDLPADRWPLDFLHPDPDEAVATGRSYGRAGAFLAGFADFDPAFFRLAPRDAAAMDPQERLFLMSAWSAFEDAGYGPARLARRHGGQVGVFAGITKTGYALHPPFELPGGALARPTTSFAGAANRVSHVMGLHGPSLPVDTMCSSSLTAIHLACEALHARTCDMALAGGVNLYLHPSNFVELSAARMLSPTGRCRSFGADADGFAPGEGVGCVVLKPLSRALADGDRVHAVIRASAVNHGGHANGYTVPNPAAQRDLVRAALARADVRADAIGYVEAHGTGTELGDPIELDGLVQAFGVDTAATGFCALGSVKASIGHLEAAAGMAGLTKVLLQMRHGQLAPSLHAQRINPNLDFAGTPFVLQRSLAPWPAARRIAGISSFGAGGANAHVIVAAGPDAMPTATTGPQAVILSARDEDRLRAQARNLRDHVQSILGSVTPTSRVDVPAHVATLLGVAPTDVAEGDTLAELGLTPGQRAALAAWLLAQGVVAVAADDLADHATLRELANLLPVPVTAPAITLADLAYTLQVGREAMDARLAVAVDSLPDLVAALDAWLDGRDHPGLHTGHARDHRAVLAPLAADGELAPLMARWFADNRFARLLPLWVAGADIDWEGLPRPTRPAIVSLPTYPFARQRLWPGDGARDPLAAAIATAPPGAAPLLAEAQRLEAELAHLLAALRPALPQPIAAHQRWRAALDDLLTPHANTGSVPVDQAWKRWSAFAAAQPPDSPLAAQIALADAALRPLADILAGRMAATAALFPGGDMALVEAVYRANPVAARFSHGLATALAVHVARAPRAVRILEIGAGTGGTTAPILDALTPRAARVAEYRYTDVSRAFLRHAETVFAPHAPFLATSLFDVERPPAEQGLAPGTYDVVVAANVLHATADMARTLLHVRALLVPDGVLLLNETTQPTLFTHITFGLLEGWWRFTDPARRLPGSPSLSAAAWRAVLAETGFAWLAGSRDEEQALGQQLIAAQAMGAAPVAVPAPTVPVPAMPAPAVPGLPLRDALRALLAEVLGMAASGINVNQAFADLGLDSILGMQFVHRLNRSLGITFDQTRLFDFASITRLEAHLARTWPHLAAAPTPVPQPAPVAQPAKAAITGREAIAIVGVSGRFAKSATMDDLWQHLLAGHDLVEPVPTTRFDLGPLYRDAAPGTYGRHGSFIDGVDQFDPVFFGISGLEATYMDPQQRLFLEEAWSALENAGHAGADMAGRRCGVFVGCSAGDYHEHFGEKPPGQSFWGNTISLIPSRISYYLDLNGPAVAVDTACSSSLVAIHLACQSIWNGESEMALAGGVFVHTTPRFYRYANQARMLSPTGRCAAFGADADGIVPGEAVGAVLLRPLTAALADGDTIHAVIEATAINQDGATNGISAPSAVSQEHLIADLYRATAIDPETIGLVEAHGTGTPLGDPIEHAALTRAFARFTARRNFCALGSIKSNIGHATTAAGIAGLARILLALRHGTIPPSIHYGAGNPAIDMAASPFLVNDAPRPWPAGPVPRRAALSSFGFSGTNAHLVVRDHAAAPLPDLPGDALIVLSARTPVQVRQQAERLLAWLDGVAAPRLADIAFTLLAGRRHLHHRLAVVVHDADDLRTQLRAWLDGAASRVVTAELDDRDHRADPARINAARDIVAALRAGSSAWHDLADHYLAGADVAYAQAFVPGAVRRVPLPAYPFARRRYWVDALASAPARVVAVAPAAPATAGLPIRLAAPAIVAGLAAAPVARLLRHPDEQGVRHLEVEGPWTPAMRAEMMAALAAADGDAAVRAVLIAATDWTDVGDSLGSGKLPVVATARSADVAAPTVDAAHDLAREVARAPRDALIALKRHLRDVDVPVARRSPHFAATAPSPGSGVPIPLRSGVVTLEAFPDGVLLIRLLERQHRNMFTPAFMDGLVEAFAAVQARADRRVVVLTGHDGYFATGGTREGLEELQRGAARFTDRRIYSLPLDCDVPVIAAMQGHAIGAGWSLGLFCDHQVVADEGVYHSNYLRFGFTPGAGATLVFPHRLGPALAREILFTAREYRGRELAMRAPDLHVRPAATVLDDALAGAHALARQPQAELLVLKAELAAPLRQRLDDMLARELALHERTFIGNTEVAARIATAFAPAPAPAAATPAPAPAAPALDVRTPLIASLAEELMIDAAEIRDASGFLDLGLDSILAVTWLRRLNRLFAIDLPATAVYAHPTVGALVAHVATLAVAAPPAPADVVAAPPAAPESKPEAVPRAPDIIVPTPVVEPEAIAIIGASGRFPKAPDLAAFWANIAAGRDCIDDVPPSRWDVARHYHPDPLHPDTSYCRWMGAIDDIDRFDASFFNITPREAELMDPQQRLFLQHAWSALEDAALNPRALGGASCGIFVGAGPSGYADLISERNSYSLLGASGSILAARIAHLLDLRGPALSLDTACSSSLVAIVQACNSLILGDCDMALAGGVCVMVGPAMFVDTSKVGMLSPDGRCFTFDGRANGFVPGEGAGVVLLKRLSDARRDGDPIRAIVRGWGSNQDGRTNGITAPNPQAQTRLIRHVQEKFAIDPATIGLIETHGTGTALGDPIEVEGLTAAFAPRALPAGSVALGSVKSNIGHTLAAAGIAGALKAMLALEHRQLPPTINFTSLNDHIRLGGTPFMVNTALRAWPRPAAGARRVAVSSFGFSGTNAHLVLEEAAPVPVAAPPPGPYLFVLSARDHDRLRAYAGDLATFITARADLHPADIVHTLQVGRPALAVRLAFTADNRDDLLARLAAVQRGDPAMDLFISATGGDAPVAGIDGARRIALPTYPFAPDRHWIAAPAPAHPFASGRRQTGDDVHVALPVQGDDAWLTHVATSDERLPLGLFLPELVRIAMGTPTLMLRHLVWGAPPGVNGHACSVSLDLWRDGQGQAYRITADTLLWHVGEVAAEAGPADDGVFAPPAGSDAMAEWTRFAARCAVECGPPAPDAAQVRTVRRSGHDLVAHLHRPATSPFAIDPFHLDTAWRLLSFHCDAPELLFPHAMEALRALAPLPADVTLHVRCHGAVAADGADLSFHDPAGRLLLRLSGILVLPRADLPVLEPEGAAS